MYIRSRCIIFFQKFKLVLKYINNIKAFLRLFFHLEKCGHLLVSMTQFRKTQQEFVRFRLCLILIQVLIPRIQAMHPLHWKIPLDPWSCREGLLSLRILDSSYQNSTLSEVHLSNKTDWHLALLVSIKKRNVNCTINPFFKKIT